MVNQLRIPIPRIPRPSRRTTNAVGVSAVVLAIGGTIAGVTIPANAAAGPSATVTSAACQPGDTIPASVNVTVRHTPDGRYGASLRLGDTSYPNPEGVPLVVKNGNGTYNVTGLNKAGHYEGNAVLGSGESLLIPVSFDFGCSGSSPTSTSTGSPTSTSSPTSTGNPTTTNPTTPPTTGNPTSTGPTDPACKPLAGYKRLYDATAPYLTAKDNGNGTGATTFVFEPSGGTWCSPAFTAVSVASVNGVDLAKQFKIYSGDKDGYSVPFGPMPVTVTVPWMTLAVTYNDGKVVCKVEAQPDVNDGKGKFVNGLKKAEGGLNRFTIVNPACTPVVTPPTAPKPPVVTPPAPKPPVVIVVTPAPHPSPAPGQGGGVDTGE